MKIHEIQTKKFNNIGLWTQIEMRIQGTKPSISDVAIPEQKNGMKGHRTV
jgi:hypothetical protein